MCKAGAAICTFVCICTCALYIIYNNVYCKKELSFQQAICYLSFGWVNILDAWIVNSVSRLVKNPKRIQQSPFHPNLTFTSLHYNAIHLPKTQIENGWFKCQIPYAVAIASRMKRVAEFFLKHDRQSQEENQLCNCVELWSSRLWILTQSIRELYQIPVLPLCFEKLSNPCVFTQDVVIKKICEHQPSNTSSPPSQAGWDLAHLEIRMAYPWTIQGCYHLLELDQPEIRIPSESDSTVVRDSSKML